MRYAFMGNRDVPEWLLAEVATLSRITCVRLKLICKQVLNELLGGKVDFAKVQKLIPKEKGFSLGDVKAAIGSVNYILSNAARHAVDHKAALHTAAAKRTLALPRLTALQWRVDYVVASSNLKEARVPVAHLQLHTSHASNAVQTKPSAAEMGVQVSLAANRAGDAASSAAPSEAGTTKSELAARMDAACRALGVSAAGQPARSDGPTLQLSMDKDKLLALLSELRTARDLMEQTRSTLTEV